MSLWEGLQITTTNPALGQTTDAFILNYDAVDGLEDDLRYRPASTDGDGVSSNARPNIKPREKPFAISEGCLPRMAVRGVATCPYDVAGQYLADASSKILDLQSAEKANARRRRQGHLQNLLMTDLRTIFKVDPGGYPRFKAALKNHCSRLICLLHFCAARFCPEEKRFV